MGAPTSPSAVTFTPKGLARAWASWSTVQLSHCPGLWMAAQSTRSALLSRPVTLMPCAVAENEGRTWSM